MGISRTHLHRPKGCYCNRRVSGSPAVYGFSGIQVHASEGFNLYTDTPGIYVTAGDSVSFDLHLVGGNAAEKDVSLSVSSIPDGFGGYIKSGTMRFPGSTPAGKLLILSLLSR